MHPEDEEVESSTFEDIIVVPTPPELADDVEEPETYSTADLVAIYSLLKAGFSPSDFD